MASKSTKLDELSKSLTSASPEELRKIQSKINGLLDLSGSSRKLTVAEDDWLYDGIVDELVSRGLLHLKAAGSLQRSNAYKSYKAKAGPVRDLLLKQAPGLDTSKTVLRAFGARLAYCLAESLSAWTVVTPALMLSQVDRIPSAVDECFPGYGACGLLAKLVKVTQSA